MLIKIERECCAKEDLRPYRGEYDLVTDDEDVCDVPHAGQMYFCAYCGQQWHIDKTGFRRRVFPGAMDAAVPKISVGKPLGA